MEDQMSDRAPAIANLLNGAVMIALATGGAYLCGYSFFIAYFSALGVEISIMEPEHHAIVYIGFQYYLYPLLLIGLLLVVGRPLIERVAKWLPDKWQAHMLRAIQPSARLCGLMMLLAVLL
jgi:hypothetical protein